MIEKGEGAPPWGRRRGRSAGKEPKAGEADEEEESDHFFIYLLAGLI